MMGALLLQTKRELGGTIQLPMACSHEQAGAGGHPSARDSQLPKEDRLTYSTSARLVSNNHMPSATGHIPCESRQAFLPQVDTRHAWLGRNLRIDSRSAQPSEILLRMREAVPVELFGHAMLHWDVALGLNPQADESLSKGGRDLVPYRRSLVGWRPLYAFRSHTVIHFDHSPRTSLSNTLLQQMLLNFLEVVLFEIAPVAKKDAVCSSLCAGRVVEAGKLDATKIISQLEKSILLWRRISVDNGALIQRIAERSMYGTCNNALPVVVINLYDVVALEEGYVFIDEDDQILLHTSEQSFFGCIELFLIREGVVLKRNMLGKSCKLRQISFALFDRQGGIGLVRSHQRRHMEWNVGHPILFKSQLMLTDCICQIVCLVVENQRDNVVKGFRADVTGLVNEYGKFFHIVSKSAFLPLDKKNAGGHPPALDSPLQEEDHFSYTTSSCGISRIMFLKAFERSAA